MEMKGRLFRALVLPSVCFTLLPHQILQLNENVKLSVLQ